MKVLRIFLAAIALVAAPPRSHELIAQTRSDSVPPASARLYAARAVVIHPLMHSTSFLTTSSLHNSDVGSAARCTRTGDAAIRVLSTLGGIVAGGIIGYHVERKYFWCACEDPGLNGFLLGSVAGGVGGFVLGGLPCRPSK